MPAHRIARMTILLLSPALLLAGVAAVKGVALGLTGPAFWNAPRAGEQHLGEARAAVRLLRRNDVQTYALGAGFESNTLLFQRTVEGGWPARPERGARHRLTRTNEPLKDCRERDRWQGFSLRVCR